MRTSGKLSTIILSTFAMVLLCSAVISISSPQYVSAKSDTCKSAPKFLTFPPWYEGLTKGSGTSKEDCELTTPESVGGISNFIWRIALNIVEILLQAVAYIVVAMIMTAGFKLLTSEGKPDQAVNARNTITMAAVGFAISVAGVAAINLISSIFITN